MAEGSIDIKVELTKKICKVSINMTDGPNNIENNITTIPAIDINIIIYQQTDELEDGGIESKGALTDINKRMIQIRQMHW